MKSQRDRQRSGGGVYVHSRNTNLRRGMIPTSELPCSSKTGKRKNIPPPSDHAPSLLLKGHFQKVTIVKAPGRLLHPYLSHKIFPVRSFPVTEAR